MGQRICMIGGQGFIGSHLLRQAVAAGYKVTVGCRHAERARHLLVEGVRLSELDVVSNRGIAEAVADADIVINLAGILREKGQNSFDEVHVQGTKRIITACEQAAVQRYIHISALGADKQSESHYARSKAEAESLLQASSLTYTIVRPSLVYGHGDAFFSLFSKLAKTAPVLPVISGSTRFQPIWVDDVARAILFMLNDRHSKQQTVELCGPEVLSMQDMLEQMLNSLSCHKKLIAVPQGIASILAKVGDILPLPINSEQLSMLSRDNIASTAQAYPASIAPPARLSTVLPSIVEQSFINRQQHEFDHYRKAYWK